MGTTAHSDRNTPSDSRGSETQSMERDLSDVGNQFRIWAHRVENSCTAAGLIVSSQLCDINERCVFVIKRFRGRPGPPRGRGCVEHVTILPPFFMFGKMENLLLLVFMHSCALRRKMPKWSRSPSTPHWLPLTPRIPPQDVFPRTN